RRHVGKHHVGWTVKRRLEPLRRAGIEKIELHEFAAGYGFYRQEVDGDYAPRRAGASRSYLAPASGRGTEVDHACAFLQEVGLVIDLDELEGGARTKSFALGARDVRIVELALQPELGREFAALTALDAHFKLAGAAGLASFAHGFVACPAPHTPSSRIICTSMPSRSPRSATRRRGQGNARRIASRMAQPASTRSARSAPMQGLATRSS